MSDLKKVTDKGDSTGLEGVSTVVTPPKTTRPTYGITQETDRQRLARLASMNRRFPGGWDL